MYGAVDPIYMRIQIRRLGPDYIVWDEAAKIEFKKPGRETLHAHFLVTDEEAAVIRSALDTEPSVDRRQSVDLLTPSGKV
jgi:hypothetical protein